MFCNDADPGEGVFIELPGDFICEFELHRASLVLINCLVENRCVVVIGIWLVVTVDELWFGKSMIRFSSSAS